MHITKNTLLNKFKELGINFGNTVEVHSSLSSFGDKNLTPELVIDALIEVIGDSGTLLMSAYPVSKVVPLTEEDKKLGIHWKVQRLPREQITKSGMGIIVDTFVKYKGVIIGNGRHPIAAWGKDADKYLDNYSYLTKINGKVLLLGVGIDRCSSMHMGEDIPLPNKISKIYELPKQAHELYPSDRWSIGGTEPPGDAWGKIYNWGKQNKYVIETIIGQSLCSIFPITALLDEFRKQRKNNPFELYEVNND